MMDSHTMQHILGELKLLKESIKLIQDQQAKQSIEVEAIKKILVK